MDYGCSSLGCPWLRLGICCLWAAICRSGTARLRRRWCAHPRPPTTDKDAHLSNRTTCPSCTMPWISRSPSTSESRELHLLTIDHTIPRCVTDIAYVHYGASFAVWPASSSASPRHARLQGPLRQKLSGCFSKGTGSLVGLAGTDTCETNEIARSADRKRVPPPTPNHEIHDHPCRKRRDVCPSPSWPAVSGQWSVANGP